MKNKQGVEIVVKIPYDEDVILEDLIEKAPYMTELFSIMNRAENKWADGDESYQDHDDKRIPSMWCEDIAAYAYWAKLMRRMDSPEKYRKRMLQIAGLALHAVMSFDRIEGGEE